MSTSGTHSLVGSAWPWNSTRGCRPSRGPSASRSGRYLVLFVSAWFLLLFLLPVIAYDGNRRWLDLDGIFQVFRSENGSTWTVLHFDGTVLTIPTDVISLDQLDYLKSFALRSARERKAAAASH